MKISSFQFSNPSITDVKFTKNLSFKFNKAAKMTNSFNIEIMNKNKDSAIVELSIYINENIIENSPFKLSLKIRANFNWLGELKNPDIFLRQNAPALLISYARPIITNLTSSAGLPPYNIPFIDFTK